MTITLSIQYGQIPKTQTATQAPAAPLNNPSSSSAAQTAIATTSQTHPRSNSTSLVNRTSLTAAQLPASFQPIPVAHALLRTRLSSDAKQQIITQESSVSQRSAQQQRSLLNSIGTFLERILAIPQSIAQPSPELSPFV